MLKKRIIFTLLYKDGSFCLSRNFNLQKVGNLNWIKKNYDFSLIAKSIDELIILKLSYETNLLTWDNIIQNNGEFLRKHDVRLTMWRNV